MSNFSLWLDAECLDEGWRLRSYSRMLDKGATPGTRIYGEVESLLRLLARNPALVLECFAKLMGRMENQALEVRTESAQSILLAGLRSEIPAVCANAELARESLLRKGRFEFLELEA